MKKSRRLSFTLLEVLIAMTIAMGVFVTGLYFYRYAAFVDVELKKDEEKQFKARLLMSRLASIFSRLKKGFFFTSPEQAGYTVGPSLIFSFRSDSRLPYFHGWVISRLFVDPQKRLILAIWEGKPPQGMPPHMHTEVLAENIEGLEMEMLVGPTNHPGLKVGAFLNEWLADYEQNPVALKLRLKNEGKEFAFPLSTCGEE